MTTIRRLPSKIRLPFNFVIRVVLTSDREMLDAMDEDDRSELADGLWDVDSRTIYVRRSLGFKRKAEVLGHELDHALNDWRHWVRDTLEQGRLP
ncbi:MAG TPA: hypothetical protein VFM88_09375 [Vicinamibacteria bacterium]|nr:hypothetical protein [Vicinamibacteria bacterium]